MIKLQKIRDLTPNALSQGLKLHPYLPKEVSVYSCKSAPTRRKASLVLSYGLFFLLAVLVAGCSRDPNVRKLKFLQQGEVYFEKGKYPEANISYSRALQIDHALSRLTTSAPRAFSSRGVGRRPSRSCRARLICSRKTGPPS